MPIWKAKIYFYPEQLSPEGKPFRIDLIKQGAILVEAETAELAATQAHGRLSVEILAPDESDTK